MGGYKSKEKTIRPDKASFEDAMGTSTEGLSPLKGWDQNCGGCTVSWANLSQACAVLCQPGEPRGGAMCAGLQMSAQCALWIHNMRGDDQ